MRTGSNGKISFLFFCPSFFTFLFLIAWKAEAKFESVLTPSALQYASENSPTIRITDKTIFSSNHFFGEGAFFFESGSKGTWTFDPDPFRYRLEWGGDLKQTLWIGRAHPLQNDDPHPIEPTSASGAIWVQNQMDALHPRVSGWIGAGYQLPIHPHWKLLFSYSPVFIPTFSPRLGFTDRGELNPARFARPPPNVVETDGVRLPIRYQLKLNQLSELLLRNQVFSGINFKSDFAQGDFYFYTGPKPDPVPLTNATLSVSDSGLNAKVLIIPQFPREYWSGFRFKLKKWLFEPTLEFVQNLELKTYRLISIAGNFGPNSHFSQFGLLTRLGNGPETPEFSNFLVFFNIPIILTHHLSTRMRIESTLLPGKRSLYWAQELEISLRSGFSSLLGISVLAGQDQSYFGAWRNESSMSVGVKKTW